MGAEGVCATHIHPGVACVPWGSAQGLGVIWGSIRGDPCRWLCRAGGGITASDLGPGGGWGFGAGSVGSSPAPHACNATGYSRLSHPLPVAPRG